MDQTNPNHKKTRKILRIAGPSISLIGLTFLIIALVSFFSAFAGNGPPKYFWCSFVGIPLIFVGIVMSKFAFLGNVARYSAEELAPVGKDTFNYMARETKPGVSDVAEAFFEGKSEAESASIEARIRKLEELRQTGVINDQDFEEQKDRILSEL